MFEPSDVGVTDAAGESGRSGFSATPTSPAWPRRHPVGRSANKIAEAVFPELDLLAAEVRPRTPSPAPGRHRGAARWSTTTPRSRTLSHAFRPVGAAGQTGYRRHVLRSLASTRRWVSVSGRSGSTTPTIPRPINDGQADPQVYSISSWIFDEHGYLTDDNGLDELEFYIVLVSHPQRPGADAAACTQARRRSDLPRTEVAVKNAAFGHRSGRPRSAFLSTGATGARASA